jgi:hypothetical protein
MTPLELDLMKIHARILAVESVLATVLSASSRSEPARESLLEALDRIVETSDKAPLRGMPAEYSDLVAAETRDAFESLAGFLKTHLNR